MAYVYNIYLVHLNEVIFYYNINNKIYNADNLKINSVISSNDEPHCIINLFIIDIIGSEIISITFDNGSSHYITIYQYINNKFVRLTKRIHGFNNINNIKILKIPLYNNNNNINDNTDYYTSLNLKSVDAGLLKTSDFDIVGDMNGNINFDYL